VTGPAGDRDLVLAVLRRIGGGVAVGELVHKTGLPESTVVDALCELENMGLAGPWSWTATTEKDAA